MAKVPFKSKLSRYKSLEKRNEAFEALTSKEQRQEIAYDGLMMIISGQVDALRGGYWNDKLLGIETRTPESFQRKLQNLPKGCQVCERGLMMLAQIRLSNTVDSCEYDRMLGNSELVKGFTMEAYYTMEAEYEHSQYNHPYYSRTQRKLANIACNVVANGNFRKTDKTDYLSLWKITLPRSKNN